MYQRYHWAELRTHLEESYESKPFWTDEQALFAFNESLRFWNLLTARWQRTETLLTTTGYLYQTSSLMLWRTRVAFNGYPLSVSSREDLNNSRYAWRSETTTSGNGVPTRPAVWAPISLQTFYLWPADAAPVNTLTVEGVAATPVLAVDAGFVDLGEEHLDVIVDYALHRLLFSKAGEFFSGSLSMFRDIVLAAGEENSQIKASQLYRRIVSQDQSRNLKLLRGVPNVVETMGSRKKGP